MFFPQEFPNLDHAAIEEGDFVPINESWKNFQCASYSFLFENVVVLQNLGEQIHDLRNLPLSHEVFHAAT